MQKLYSVKQNRTEMNNILIIDDDTDMCWVLSEVLKEEGYGTHIVHDKKNALSGLAKQKYDLVVLDYKIGDEDGLSILEEIKKKKYSGKVVMISAYGNKEINEKARLNGAVDFIDKPFDIVKFVNKINKLIK